MKICSKCGIEKPFNEFHRNKRHKDGHMSQCKKCRKIYFDSRKEYKREYDKKYSKQPKNIERIREYRQLNKDKIRKQGNEYREKLENRKHKSEYNKKYYEQNKESRKAYHKKYRQNPEVKKRRSELQQKYHREKRKNNPIVKLNDTMRGGIWKSLKRKKNGYHWESLVGYTANDLMKHLESQFVEGMLWDNYGSGGWHIDHIIPTSWWEFESYEDDEFKQCWALCNLQPMWASENCSKQNKYTG